LLSGIEDILVQETRPGQGRTGFDVSIIIPSNHSHEDLLDLTLLVCNQSVTPAEIVIIDSSDERGECPRRIQERCFQLAINLTYESVDHAYPGGARNIGIEHAKHQFIAFIDVRTSPGNDWLAVAKDLLKDHTVFGVWGRTNFEAETKLEKLTRDGFFGRNSRRTLPGTVLRKEAVKVAGQFVSWVRAGEDTDWLQRITLFGLNFRDPPNATISYSGLLNQNPLGLAKKWSQNYTASRFLPHLFPQKILIWITFYPILVLMALNWNNLVAGWKTESIFYVPNITKIVAASPGLIYILIRGIVLPLKRGVPVLETFPFRWLAIAAICAVGDGVKAAAFLALKKSTGHYRRTSR
jgi:hypothetical protein